MGSISLFMGPMFSGKTTELMRCIRMATLAEQKCCILKYSKDVRYTSDNVISNHDAYMQPETDQVKIIVTDNLSAVNVDEFDVIGIDEGQFYPDLYVCDSWAIRGKKVYVSALDGDFMRKPFEPITKLIPLCEMVTKLTGVCMDCKKNPSVFTKRTVKSLEVVLIGGSESYHAVCRQCYAASQV